MDIAHSVAIRVFCNENENENDVLSGMKLLLPLNLEEEKVAIRKQTALGFNDRKISIFEVALTKKRHVRAFLDNIARKIPDAQREMLLRQLGTRIDENSNFFVRFDKETLIKHGELIVTDSGNCYHARIKIAAFPSTKERAVAIAEGMLSKTKTI